MREFITKIWNGIKDAFHAFAESKFVDFIIVCTWFLASIGGTAYLFYDHRDPFGITNIALALMASPYVQKRFKHLLEI